MKTLLETIHESAHFLTGSIRYPKRDAEELIAEILGMKRAELYLYFDRPILETEKRLIEQALCRRRESEPLAYISGKVEFGGSVFKVTSAALVPRPETEILVEKIASTLQEKDCRGKILWDMCTGSGCIGISLKKKFPELTVICSDLSEKALELAKENACGFEITFLQGDLFSPFQGRLCDFFVCNPPYVTEEEYQTLAPELYYEPKEALIGGKTGLEFYEKIASSLKNYLHKGGEGWLEIGAGQGEKVKEIFLAKNWNCYFEPDWSGHDRFFFCSKAERD